MASADVAEEFIAGDGIVATGVYGVAVAPTSATDPLDVTWTDQGLVSDAGVVITEQVTATARRAWQNNRKLRMTISETAQRFSFTLIQTNEDSVELFHGVPVEADGSLVRNLNRERPRIAFCLDMIDPDDDTRIIRAYCPDAQVVEVGERTAASGGGFQWPVTIDATYDETLGGHVQWWFSELDTGS